MSEWNLKYLLPFDNNMIDKYKKYIQVINSYKNINPKKIIINNSNKKIDNNNFEKYFNNFDEIKNDFSINLLKIQFDITNNLFTYTKFNNFFDYNFLNSSLKLLLNISILLQNRLNLKPINSKKKSIYKFCNFKDNCIYNYGCNKKKCYTDHYVHNKLSNDLKLFLQYINNKNNSNTIKINFEIKKNIKTLLFVIKHMYFELNTLCLYVKEDKWESFHNIK